MRNGSSLRVLELYGGIGGVSAALAGAAAEIVAAVDINRDALEVYAQNFTAPTLVGLVEGLSQERLERFNADLWWASPPCQPFTRRGHQLALDDPRAATFLALLERLEAVRPRYFALENVVGFESSPARAALLASLGRGGYRHILERTFCPSQLGVPNRRPRFYLLASRDEELIAVEQPGAAKPSQSPLFSLASCLDPEVSDRDEVFDELRLAPEIYERYRHAIHLVEANDGGAITRCFTSAYGRSPVRSGSYLAEERGARHFSPLEILRLLGFGREFTLPAVMSPREGRGAREKARKKMWRLAGNSLSLPAVRHMLRAIPELGSAI